MSARLRQLHYCNVRFVPIAGIVNPYAESNSLGPVHVGTEFAPMLTAFRAQKLDRLRENWASAFRFQRSPQGLLPYLLRNPSSQSVTFRLRDVPLRRLSVREMTMAGVTRQWETEIPTRHSVELADVEYRLLFNAVDQAWDVYRNGVATALVGRQKRTSAIDSAIREAKAELETLEAAIMVTCLQGHDLETIWRGTCFTPRKSPDS